MWNCPKCRERVVDGFDVCWNCGTSKDGIEDPTFVSAEDRPSGSESRGSTDTEERPAGEETQEAPDLSAEFRGRRRFRLSGFGTACWLVLALGVTGLLIPTVLRLPIWIDFEVVLAVWWTIWLGALTSLLYTGNRLSDDHRLHEPRNWFALAKTNGNSPKRAGGIGGGWWPWVVVDGEGCVYALGLLLALAVLAARRFPALLRDPRNAFACRQRSPPVPRPVCAIAGVGILVGERLHAAARWNRLVRS
jgi:hypothetical protein